VPSAPLPDGDADHAELNSVLQLEIEPELLTLALTHRSFAYENGGIGHNERLEFLGDSILGQAVTVMLYLETFGNPRRLASSPSSTSGFSR